MLTFIFTHAARAEMIDAQDWYALTGRLSTNPQQFPVVFKNLLRALLRYFPSALFFAVAGDTSFVIACFHASRDPLQWQRRT